MGIAIALLAMTISLSSKAQYFTESFEGTYFLNGVSPITATAAGPNAPSTWTQTRTVNNVAPSTACSTSAGKDWGQMSWSGTAYTSVLNTGLGASGCSPFGGAPTAPPDGSKVMWFYDGWCSSGHTRRIESPAINLTTATSPVLSFSYSYAQNSTSLTVVGSLDGGTTWNTLSTLALTTSGVWVTKVVVIPFNYKVANAKIGYQIVSTFGSFDAFVDNVVVREGTAPANAAPITYSATAITGNTTTVNWVDNSTNETSFNVYRSTDNINFSFIGSTASTTTAGTATAYSQAQTGLTPGTTYFYRISAVAAEGESGTLSGSTATTAAVTYYYVGAATGSDLTTAASWNTLPGGGGVTRTVPATTDVLIIDGIGTANTAGGITIAMAASTSIGALQITNSTAVTLTSTTTTTRTITLTGAVGDELSIPAGSSLILNNATNAAAIVFLTGSGMTGDISGTLSLGGGTGNALTTTGGTGTVVTVSSTGIVNNAVNASSGNFTGSAATLVMANGSTLNVSGATTGAPAIPLATWGTTSNIVITGITTSTTGPTNNAQSFGNFTYNCPAASASMNIFGSTTTAVIKGNLTITATGTGTFRAVSTGTLNVTGNVFANGGTFQNASSTGTLIVSGSTTIGASGKIDILAGTYSQRGTTFTNNGVLTGVASTSTLQFLSFTNIAQTFTGTGTVLTNVGVMSVQNGGGLTISTTNQVPLLRVNLFIGTVTGANKITIGTGAALGTTVQIGSTGLVTPGGSFDANPVMNLGTGTYTVLYQFETTARSTGFEIPATRLVSAATIGNPNNVTVAGGGLGIGTLTLQSGNLITSAANLVTITGTTTASTVRTSLSLTGGSSSGTTVTVASTTGLLVGMNVSVTAGTGSFAANTVVTSVPSTTTFVVSATPTLALTGATVAAAGGWVNGPLALVLPISLVSGSTYTFPVGKGSYNPFELVNPTTNAGASIVAQAEVFDGNSGGTPGVLMGVINTTRYWAASITANAGSFTNSFIRLNDTRGTQDAIGASATQGGAYDKIGAIASTLTATSITTATTPVTSLIGFYLMGNLASASLSNLAITPTGNQCTNVARTVTVTVTPGGAAVTGVTINYQVNGGAVQTVNMTNLTGNGGLNPDNWSGVIPTVTPTNGTVTWSVTATDANSLTKTQTGTSYADEPLNGFTASASASLTTICSGSSTVLTATLNGSAAPSYIAPPAVANPTTDEDFGNITITQGANTILNNTTAGGSLVGTIGTASGTAGSYSNFTAFGPYKLTPGGTYNLSVSSITQGGSFGNAMSVWIDFNGNGLFTDAGEQVFTQGTITGPHTSTGTFTVPSNAVKGLARMRVLVNEGAITGPTQTPTWGEYEEYMVSFVPSITSVSWFDGTGSTVGNPLTVNPTTNTSYTATVTASGCTVAASPVAITVNPLPAAPSTGPSSQCGTATPTCFAVGTSNGNYRWYLVPTGGTALAGQVNDVLSAYPISSTTTFYVSIFNGTCESLRTSVVGSVLSPDPVAASSNGPVCSNTPLTLTATVTAISVGNNYTYTWAANTGTGSGIATTQAGGTGAFGTPASTNVTPTIGGVSYTYTVTAVDGGCTTTGQVTVFIKAPPAIDSVRANPAAICSGAPVTLNVYSSVIGTGPQSAPGYTAPPAVSNPTTDEDFGNITIQQGATTLLNNTTALGSLVGTIGTATGTAGSYSNFSAIAPFTVTAGQVYTFSLSSITTGTSFSNAMAFFIDYNRDGLFTGTGEAVYNQGATISGPHTVTGSFTIPLTASAGWARLRVLVNEGTISSPTQAVTWGEYEEYMVNIQGIISQNPALTYTWSTTQTGATISVNPTSQPTQTYTVTAFNAVSGCTSIAGSVAVTVNPVPSDPSPTSSAQCGAVIPTASVASNSGLPSPIFVWYDLPSAGTALQTNTSTTYLAIVSTTTTFYVSEKTAFGCESGRVAITVTVDSPDPLTVSATPASVCIGGSTSISSLYTPGFNTFATFNLTATGGAASGVTGTVALVANPTGSDPYSVTPTAVGTYIYTITAYDPDKGCTSIGTVSVTVSAYPVIDSVRATPTTVCAGQPVTLKVYSSVIAAGPQSAPGYTAPPAVSNPTTDEDFGNITIQQGATTLLNNTTALGSLVGTIGTATGTAGSYSNFSAIAPFTVTAGQVYTFSLSSITTGTSFSNAMAFFIDYNRDGLFTGTGEAVYNQGATISGPHTVTGSFTIPLTASAGWARLRVLVNEGTISSPTQTLTWGEYEEYMVNIIGVNTQNPAYTYSWSNSTPVVVGTAAATTVDNPTASTSYIATVTNLGCSTPSSAVAVTVNPLPAAPTLGAYNATKCGPGTVTLTATGAGGTLNWYGVATGGTILAGGANTGSFVATLVLGVNNFWVEETSAAGCKGPRSQVTITVNAAPSLVITPGGATTFCAGSSVTLNGTTGSDPSYVNFTWSPATDLSATTGAVVTATPSVTRTYTLTASDGLPNGCTNVTTITLTVNPNPTISTALATPATICAGGSSVLSATSTNIPGGAATIGTATTTVSTSGNPFRAGNGVGNQIRTQLLITATQMGIAGITAGNITSLAFNSTSTSGTFDNLDIQMGATAVTALTSTFETSTMTPVYFIGSYTPGVGLNTFVFSTPFAWDGTSNILINVCQQNNVLGTNTLSAFTPPTVSDNHQSGTLTGCTDLTGLTNAAMPTVRFGADQTSSYNWVWNPGALPGSSVTVTPASTTNYTVTATNPITGCFTVSPVVMVTVTPVAAAPTASPATICAGASSLLSANASGGAPFTYLWSTGATTATISVAPATTTTYTVVVSDVCGNPTAAMPVTVTVNPLPTSGITPAGPITLCSPATQVLTAVTDAGAATYQWTLNGTNIPSATGATYTVTGVSTGTYRVIVTNTATGCISAPSTGVVVTINPQPTAVTITPATATICTGASQTLVATGGTTFIQGAATATTGTISVAIPDVSATGISNSLAVSGIPAGATIDSVIVTFNITHGFDQDVIVDLEGPNGQILNLVSGVNITGGSTGFANTRVSSDNTKPAFPTTGTPFTGTFKADAALSGFQLAPSPLPTTASYSALFGTGNGTWNLRAYDDEAIGTGTLTNWSIKVSYTYAPATTFTWTPLASGLNTYTGTTVIASPVTTTTYVATATNAAGCSNTGSATVTVNPLPTVSYIGLAATYCTTDAAVTLTGNQAPGGTFSISAAPAGSLTDNANGTASFDPAIAGAGTYTITYTYTNGNGCTNSVSHVVTVAVCNTTITVNMKMWLQGYYQPGGGGSMLPVLSTQGIVAPATETDSVTIELHDPITYALVDTKIAVINTDGTVSATFGPHPFAPYYIAVKHRNSSQTWSANPVNVTGTSTPYNFTTASTQALNDPAPGALTSMAEVETGIWAIRTGDINQDDFIDGSDFTPFDTESASGGLFDGTYTASDMNGDGFVDGSDLPVFDGNSSIGVTSYHY